MIEQGFPRDIYERPKSRFVADFIGSANILEAEPAGPGRVALTGLGVSCATKETLEAKGWIAHREIGRTFLYSPAQPRHATVAQKVRDLLDNVCGGSPEMLVNGLLDSRGLTRQELARVRSILDSAHANRSSKKEP